MSGSLSAFNQRVWGLLFVSCADPPELIEESDGDLGRREWREI
jgi:hypothetical protein